MIRIWITSILLWNATGCAILDECAAQQESAPATQSGDEFAHLRALLTRQVDAWNQGDLDGFMDTYWKSPELTFSSGGATTRGWHATLDRYKARYPDKKTMGQLAFDQLEFHSLGSHAALVLGNWKLTTSAGNPMGNFSLVLEKKQDRWVIIHDHSSSLLPAESDD